ncbi:MAG: DUF2752 domain-containing protein [Thermomonas hydrothermalis]|uniref:DUF2752 domain-containing protein n=1 Tax=Thermomonas hydrothermalis TaxID=213588 RepID=UPI000932DFAF|nr:DUF2752 domain-containing protein [Thermomonas hydrothermalis]MCL6619251.1 DUF2752 domain-containing protein [Thermomonas hydrothermalis]
MPGLVLAAGAATVAAVLWRLNPFAPGSPLPPCPIHALTGLYCPGCGSTRCLYALVHADLPLALAMNPLLVVSLPALGLMTLNAAGWRPRWATPLSRYLANPRYWLWTLLGFAVLRNLPWWPFTWLAPG